MKASKLALLCICVSVCASWWAFAGETYVDVKDQAVVQNRQIDYNDEEIAHAVSITITNGDLDVRSKVFRPPPNWVFLKFRDVASENWPMFVDIAESPEQLKSWAEPDSAGAIGVNGIYLPPENAGTFPMRCEGNLKPIGKGGVGGLPSEPKPHHWSAKIDFWTNSIDLDVDSDNNNGVYGPPHRDEKEDKIEEQTPGKYIPRNDGDSDNDQIPDLVDGLGLLGSDGATIGTNRFVPIVLDVKDAGLIDWAKAKVKFRYLESDPNKVRQVGPSPKHWYMADGGAIRIWNELLTGSRNPKSVDEDGNWVKGKQYLASKIFESGSTEVTLYIEGIARGSYKTDITAEFDARGDGNWLQDKVHVTVICVDEDVDSDNTRGVRVPERDEYEDRIEDATGKSEYPGKFVVVNDGDADGDGVIDYADWHIMNGPSFVPYLVTFQEPLDVNKLRLRLRYEGSDSAMVTNGALPLGKLRLWRKNASTQRDPRPSNAGGDYVAPDEYEGPDLWRLPWASARTVILGMEGVNAADRMQIQVEVDPDGTNGPAQWVHLDAVRVTALKVDSVEVHANDTDTHKIAAVAGATHDDHFVCVKDTGDIILDATLSPNTAAAADAITWEADGAIITSPAVGTDKTTAKLSSAAGKKIPVRIKVGDCTCWEGIVWVVWCDMAGTLVNGPATVLGDVDPETGPDGPGAAIQTFWTFETTIKPAEIISEADRPDLSGAPVTKVPNWNASNVHDMMMFGQPAHKWDISRQIRIRALSPTVGTGDYEDILGPMYNGLPATNKVVQTTPDPGTDSYPGNELEGNDDNGEPVEDNDPYDTVSPGKLTDNDQPTVPVLVHRAGAVGDTLEWRFQYREFIRLELNGMWYRASDFYLWRHHARMKKYSEAAEDQDINTDGDKDDELWINNNNTSISDSTNNGW